MTADIIAREVVVCGNVKGIVRAKGKIEIKKDGSVIGDLTTAQIIIEDGAYFKGSIEIDRSADKQADNNVSRGKASRQLRHGRRWAPGRGVSNHEGMLRILRSE